VRTTKPVHKSSYKTTIDTSPNDYGEIPDPSLSSQLNSVGIQLINMQL